MKKVLFLVFCGILIFSHKSYSQTQTITDVVTGFSFGFMAGQTYHEDGKIKYLFHDDGTDKNLVGYGGITRSSNHLNDLINLEAYILFEHPNGSIDEVSNHVPFTEVDFRAPESTATSSINKQFNVTIPANFNQGGKLRRAYFGKVNSGNMEEVIDDDWEVIIVVPSKITGPNQICDEGTYTITNPGTISLENATGIATLTELGNNQWKVTKTGSSSGEIKIVSTVGTQKYTKSIIVGTKPPQIINGAPTVWSGNTYYYDVVKSDPNSTLNIDAVAGPGLPYTINVVGNQIQLTTSFIGADVHDYVIRLKASETNGCGTSSTTTYTVRFRGGEGPIH